MSGANEEGLEQLIQQALAGGGGGAGGAGAAAGGDAGDGEDDCGVAGQVMQQQHHNQVEQHLLSIYIPSLDIDVVPTPFFANLMFIYFCALVLVFLSFYLRV